VEDGGYRKNSTGGSDTESITDVHPPLLATNTTMYFISVLLNKYVDTTCTL
jgi:hypothetical protein